MQSENRSRRDPRVDVLRGLALLMLFVDHVPGNVLGFATLHMVGFADAAELFVILAGFSSLFAYGRAFDRDGIGAGLLKVGARCLRLYIFQVGLLVATFVVVSAWGAYHNILIPELLPFLSSGKEVVKHGMALGALPAKLDILPLYILLLGLFPLIHLAMRASLPVTVAVSATIWLAANLDPGLNFKNWMDGNGWYFNPYAWQFLFVLGVAGARLVTASGGSLRRFGWLTWLCWAYLAFALIASAPWTSWGLSDLRLISMPPPDKSGLSILRLLDILALIYLAVSSQRFLALARQPWLSWIDVCGRHSLEVFATATLLSLVGGLLTTTFGTGPMMQVAINVVGISAMIGVAKALERRRSPRGGSHRPQLAESAPSS